MHADTQEHTRTRPQTRAQTYANTPPSKGKKKDKKTETGGDRDSHTNIQRFSIARALGGAEADCQGVGGKAHGGRRVWWQQQQRAEHHVAAPQIADTLRS
eukprot:3935619-Rhodomonas_salina.2